MPVNLINVNAPVSPEQIAQRRALADRLMAGYADQPVRHPLQAASNFANRAAGAFNNWRANRQENKRNEALAQALGGYTPQGVDQGVWGSFVQSDPETATQFALQSQIAQQNAAAQAAADREKFLFREGYKRDNPIPTDMQKNYQMYREQGGDQDFNTWGQNWRRSGADQNTNNIEVGKGQTEVDKKFAEKWLEWNNSGGADTAAQIAGLNNSIGLLETSIESGEPITGKARDLLPESVRAFINPEGVISEEGIKEVAQRSLRVVLGAQFTAKEGEALLNRTFNKLLGPKENLRRAKLLLGKMQQIAQSTQAMSDYYSANGMSLAGYRGATIPFNNPDALTSYIFEDIDLLPEGGPKPETPEAGAVEDFGGIKYRFKGGDPSVEGNWERMTY